MRKFSLVVVFVLIAQCAWSQNRPWEFFKNIEGVYYVEAGEKDILVNPSVVTVKFKSGVTQSKVPLDTLRANKLGFIDVKLPAGLNLVVFLDSLKNSNDFELVTFNIYAESCSGFIPNDPHLSKQWYLDAINIFDAWNLTTGSPSVKLAILDVAPDWRHGDIGNVDTSLAWNYLRDSNNALIFREHGTIILGQIAAKTNDAKGIAGIAGGNGTSLGTTIIPMNLADSLGYIDASLIDDAIIDAVDSGAKIIQLSLKIPDYIPGFDTIKAAIDSAIAYAVQNDVVVVCASGNGFPQADFVSYPANHSDVIAVGAVQQDGIGGYLHASFSNYDTGLNLVAPGVDIWSTTVDNGYIYDQGTSFAAPCVSAVISLMYSVNPNLTRQEVCDIIERTAQKVGFASMWNNPLNVRNYQNGLWTPHLGYGLLDGYASVLLAARLAADTTKAPCLLIRDTPDDIGLNPNTSNLPLFESPDIYVRRTNDGGKIHQEPCIGDTAFIHVKVRNAGWDTTKGGEQLHVYLRRTDSAALWNGQWQHAASFSMKSLRSGQDTTLVFPYFFQNAASFSILSFVDTIVPPALQSTMNLVKNSHKIAMRNITTTTINRLDLMIVDFLYDFGDEPFFNFYSQGWESPSLWVRNLPDTGLTPQTAIPNTLNYIYLKIKNIGCTPSSEQDSVKIYYAKSETSLNWDSCWNGNRFNGNGPLLGDCIGTYAIPSISKDKECIMEIPWYNTPDPADYLGIIGNPWGFHLLSRIVSENDTMTYPETSNITENILNNNNIAGGSVEVFGNINLLIRDDENDQGIMPNNTAIVLNNSPDIWIRHKPDSIAEPQDPMQNSLVYVYVRITNIGNTLSRGNDKLELYWTKCPHFTWDSDWTKIQTFIFNDSLDAAHIVYGGDSAFFGRYIDAYNIPNLPPNKEVLLEIPWKVPDSVNYCYINSDPCCLSLLARIVSSYDLSDIDTLVRNYNNIAWKNIQVTPCLAKTDLWLRDYVGDNGTEPHSYTPLDNKGSPTTNWDSPDIYCRHLPDYGTTHQKPLSNDTTYIHVSVKNRGCLKSNGNDVLKLYWCKSSYTTVRVGNDTSWNYCWNGNRFNGNGLLMGDFIDSITIPSIRQNQDTILVIPWHVPNYMDYYNIVYQNLLYDFYLLAIIDSKEDTLKVSNTKNINTLIPANNNVSMKYIELARRDLLIRDTVTDNGTEPSTCSIISESPDIQIHGHAPVANKETMVHVSVRNIGYTATQGTEVLKLYWGKTTDTNMTWSSHWHFIKDTIISPISPNNSCTFQIPWTAPNPSNYSSNEDPSMFSLLARIEEGDFTPLSETEDLEQNVRQNRNIALKNVSVCEGIDLMFHRNESDNGKQPIDGNPWASPDIWVYPANGNQRIKPKPKENVEIRYKITNIGKCLSDNVKVSLYWAKSQSNITRGDSLHLIGTDKIPSLGPGTFYTSWFTWHKDSIPNPINYGGAEPWKFYLFAMIDSKDEPTSVRGTDTMEMLIKRYNNYAGKAIMIWDSVDLMVRDCPLDVGKEPNTESQYFYISEDIWVRNNRDDSLTHQNPIGYSTNWVYVKITNRGKTPSSGAEQIFLYWAKAGTSLNWSQAWDGTSKVYYPDYPLLGDFIDSVPIPQIQPGKDTVLRIGWNAPDTLPYYNLDGVENCHHFCLLARIVAPETDPMKIPEVMNKHVEVNVKNNNNIAQKNVTITDIGNGYSSIGSSIFVANWSDAIKSYCLRFKLGANATTLHQEAEITVKLGDKVFEAWQRGGGICQDVEVKEDNILLITGNNAKLCNLIFYPHEIGRMSLTFNFLTRKKIMDNLEYDIHVVQTDYQTEEVIGGEQYHVVTPPRVPFYAQADDIYAFVNDPITFHAADIGEPAVYRWYDMSGNLVCEEQNFSTVAIHEKQYKLEVIALSDGYKDYATVKVKIVPGKIEEIFPNPTDNDITVVCVFNNVDAIPEAYIQVSDYMGMIYNEFQLKNSPATVSFSTQNYPIGTYVVRLFCNGQVADVKTFVRH